jgi:hypothetical protein
VSRDEIVADDQRQIERFRHRLDAADQIDRRTDHREIEAVRGADIAVDDRAVVQRDGDPERRLAVWRRPRGERGQRLPRSGERARGCARRVVCRRRWEDREQAVADNSPLQRYAAAGSRFNARPNRSNKSSISRDVMISGGQKATTSPIARMISPSS